MGQLLELLLCVPETSLICPTLLCECFYQLQEDQTYLHNQRITKFQHDYGAWSESRDPFFKFCPNHIFGKARHFKFCVLINTGVQVHDRDTVAMED